MEIGAALLGAVAFGLYFKIYLPHKFYFDSGQWWMDIIAFLLYFVLGGVVIFLIGFSIYKYRQAKEEKKNREELKEQMRKMLTRQKEEKSLEKEKAKQKEQDKRSRDAAVARLQQEKERKEAEEKRLLDLEVQELVAFKRKYGLDAMPYNKKYSWEVSKEAYDTLKWEIRHAEILAEEKENAQQFYKVHSWQAVPERWHDMNSEKRAIWEKERQKAKNAKKDKGNARLLKALEKLDGHKNS